MGLQRGVRVQQRIDLLRRSARNSARSFDDSGSCGTAGFAGPGRRCSGGGARRLRRTRSCVGTGSHVVLGFRGGAPLAIGRTFTSLTQSSRCHAPATGRITSGCTRRRREGRSHSGRGKSPFRVPYRTAALSTGLAASSTRFTSRLFVWCAIHRGPSGRGAAGEPERYVDGVHRSDPA